MIPMYLKRYRNWSQCKAIIGHTLHTFITTKFSQLNARGKFNILEVGCGDGNTCIQLESEYSNAGIIALDLNSYNNITSNHKIVYLQKDIQEFVLEDSFDCIIGIAVLPYVKDKVRALLNIWRSLKLHGIAVLSVQPYHFGPYALNMFAHGDIVWNKNYQALVIYKKSEQFEPKNLPCLSYIYLEYTQEKLDSSDGQIRNIWPSFLLFPFYIHPYTKKLVELQPYPQSIVSLYVPNFVTIHKELASSLFSTKLFYPKLMVKNPNHDNRNVTHINFTPCSAKKLSTKKITFADVLIEEKVKQRELSNNSKKIKNDASPTCCGWLYATLILGWGKKAAPDVDVHKGSFLAHG